MNKRDYNPDGLNRTELARFKKEFWADYRGKKVKKDFRHFGDNQCPFGSCTSTWFCDAPVKLPKRLPDKMPLAWWGTMDVSKARVVSQQHSLMLVFGVEVNPNGAPETRIRSYTLNIEGKCELKLYRKKYWTTEYYYFKVYEYAYNIEEVINKFWNGYSRNFRQWAGIYPFTQQYDEYRAKVLKQ